MRPSEKLTEIGANVFMGVLLRMQLQPSFARQSGGNAPDPPISRSRLFNRKQGMQALTE